MTAPRTGVILAAGFGSRLSGAPGAARLKPLTPVGGEPLLLRAIRGLALAGCARVVVVVGHGGDAIEREYRAAAGDDSAEGPNDGAPEVVFALNERFDLANGVSVLAARPHLLGGDFIIAMADHVMGDEVMRLAATHRPQDGAATLLVDYKLDTIFDMDDATKVLAEDGRIARIGKQLDAFNCVDCGVFVCTTALLDAIAAVHAERGDASLSEGVQALASDGRMHVLDIGDGFWQDVDTAEMLAHAEQALRR